MDLRKEAFLDLVLHPVERQRHSLALSSAGTPSSLVLSMLHSSPKLTQCLQPWSPSNTCINSDLEFIFGLTCSSSSLLLGIIRARLSIIPLQRALLTSAIVMLSLARLVTDPLAVGQ